jgi:hypothetical protein
LNIKNLSLEGVGVMILVQGIGMSGYVPLEGVVALSHFRSDCFFCGSRRKCMRDSKCESKFYYLFRADLDKTDDIDIVSKVVSFAVVSRFGEFALDTIIRGVGLLSGYCCAGVVLPEKLLKMFLSICLDYYIDMCIDMSYVSKFSDDDRVTCSSAWSEYIRIDPDISGADCPTIYVEVLGFRKMFRDFRRDEFWM